MCSSFLPVLGCNPPGFFYWGLDVLLGSYRNPPPGSLRRRRVRAGGVASPLEKGLEINRVDLPPGPLRAACQIGRFELLAPDELENFVRATAENLANRRRCQKSIAEHKKTSVENELFGGMVERDFLLLGLKKHTATTSNKRATNEQH